MIINNSKSTFILFHESYINSFRCHRVHQVSKLLVLAWDVDQLYEQLEKLLKNTSLQLVRGEFFVEVLAPNTHKGKGLQDLCNHLNIPLHQVVAFGDGLYVW